MAEEKKPYQVLYDYSDAPTLRKFALDNTRIRCVIGPFGSGKSSAMVMEIIRRAHEQTPGPDGRRRTRWAVIRNCYDDQTEILTEKRGWQLFKDLLPDDAVATLVGGRELVFVEPTMHYEYDHDGEMVGYYGENIDFLVTPEHKMYVSLRNARKKEWSEYKFRDAMDVYGKYNMRVKRNADKWQGERPEYSPDFMEWFGFWVAEGWVSTEPKYECIITQSENLDYVRKLFNDAKLPFHEGHYKSQNGRGTFRLAMDKDTRKIVEMLSPLGKSHEKYVPQWVKNSPVEYITRFIKGYLAGDGKHWESTEIATSASKKLIEDLQELALRAGMVANIRPQVPPRDNLYINGVKTKQNYPTNTITFVKSSKYHPSLFMQKRIPRLLPTRFCGWYKRPYKGKVYCVEVPSHVVYVRRNGKGFWCSQSYRQLCDTTIKTFHDWFPPSIFGEYRVTDHSYFITKFPNVHIEVMFRALDRPDQVSNLLSLELTGAWFNEAREIPEAIIVAMDGRINRYPSERDGWATWAGIIMDTNPPEEGSYIYRMNEIIKPDNWKGFKQPSGLSVHAENTKHLAKNYYRDLAKGKDDMYVRVYIHGQYGFTITGKPVFQSFVDSVHVARQALEPQKGLDLLIGFDFALNPTCVLGQVTPLGQLRIIDELVSDGMGLQQFCDNILLPRLRTKYFGYSVMGFGDPSGISRSPTDESTCFDVLHSPEVGLSSIEPAPTNALIPRISAVEAFLNKMWKGEPGFLLSPTCPGLRKAMNGAYHYEKEPKAHGGDEYKAMPAKNNASHIADATQYLCLYISEKEESDKRHRSFMAQFKKMEYRAGDGITGY